MPAVHSFGKGYYAFDTEGVTVSAEVEARVKEVFARAKAIPDDQIKVRLERKPRNAGSAWADLAKVISPQDI